MKTTKCALCRTPVAYTTKPPKTCKGCRHAYKSCTRRNREECRVAVEKVGEALARLRLRGGDLAPRAQEQLAAALVVLMDPESYQPTKEQRSQRRAYYANRLNAVVAQAIEEIEDDEEA